MIPILILLFSLIFAEESFSSDDSGDSEVPLATLIIDKRFVTNDIIQDQPMRINYTIYNVGDGEATKIRFFDKLSTEHFELTEGSFEKEWPLLIPGDTLTHSLVVVPLVGGILTPSPASIYYLRHPEDTEDDVQVSHSNGEPPLNIFSAYEWDLRTNPRYTEWGILSALWLVAIVIPGWMLSVVRKNSVHGLKDLKKIL